MKYRFLLIGLLLATEGYGSFRMTKGKNIDLSYNNETGGKISASQFYYEKLNGERLLQVPLKGNLKYKENMMYLQTNELESDLDLFSFFLPFCSETKLDNLSFYSKDKASRLTMDHMLRKCPNATLQAEKAELKCENKNLSKQVLSFEELASACINGQIRGTIGKAELKPESSASFIGKFIPTHFYDINISVDNNLFEMTFQSTATLFRKGYIKGKLNHNLENNHLIIDLEDMKIGFLPFKRIMSLLPYFFDEDSNIKVNDKQIELDLNTL